MWTSEWPTVAGFYWFYGFRYDYWDFSSPQGEQTQVKDNAGIYMCHVEPSPGEEGVFFYTLHTHYPLLRQLGAKGLFYRIEFPQQLPLLIFHEEAKK